MSGTSLCRSDISPTCKADKHGRAPFRKQNNMRYFLILHLCIATWGLNSAGTVQREVARS